MKRVLYITNIEVPYRTRFFNLLAEQCDLTVLYERRHSANRNAHWASGENCRFRRKTLCGIPLRRESSFSLDILREVTAGYDRVIVGCYNSPAQMAAILWMRLLGIPYLLNVDGEVFLAGNSLKTRLKRFFLRGASGYLAAGEKAAETLREIAGSAPVVPYYFSSLTRAEWEQHRLDDCPRDKTVLVVGQFLPYKGLDVALEAARMDPDVTYRFVGMDHRTEQFRKDFPLPENVELIPFLQKKELEQEYRRCGMLVLPSRQECWGLVIPEAASFGTPIVSTWGSGAAVEFLSDHYPQYLAQPGDSQSLLRSIQALRQSDNLFAYENFLREKARNYTIETAVQAHMTCISREEGS